MGVSNSSKSPNWRNFIHEQYNASGFHEAGVFAKGRRGLTGPGPQMNPWENARIDSSGQAWVPLETVTQLIDDNEFLREELYMQQAYYPQKIYDMLQAWSGHSTKDVLNAVKRIERLTSGTFTGQDIFRSCYSQLYKTMGLNLGECPQGMSKLQWIWQMGGLPFVSMYVHSFEMFLIHTRKQIGLSGFVTAIKNAKRKLVAQRNAANKRGKKTKPY